MRLDDDFKELYNEFSLIVVLPTTLVTAGKVAFLFPGISLTCGSH